MGVFFRTPLSTGRRLLADNYAADNHRQTQTACGGIGILVPFCFAVLLVGTPLVLFPAKLMLGGRQIWGFEDMKVYAQAPACR